MNPRSKDNHAFMSGFGNRKKKFMSVLWRFLVHFQTPFQITIVSISTNILPYPSLFFFAIPSLSREWTFMTIHDTPKISCHQNAISVLVITQNITKMIFKLCAISRAEQQENIFLTTVAPKLLAIKQRRHHHVLRF